MLLDSLRSNKRKFSLFNISVVSTPRRSCAYAKLKPLLTIDEKRSQLSPVKTVPETTLVVSNNTAGLGGNVT